MKSLNLQPELILLITLVVLVVISIILLIKRTPQDSGQSGKFDEFYKKISEEIKYAVAPKSINITTSVAELIELATEVWRVEQRLAKVSEALPENQRKGLENSVNKFKRYIANYDIEVVDYTGHKFNDGLNLDVLSIEKDSAVVAPTVKETVEPTILVKGQVVKKAKVILLSN
jgi:molecular chaperone GrpE (heat shock protein)